MATPSYAAVKCLNTSSSSRKRFSFKSFSQRVEEIDIDVYRSLHTLKAEPSSGSSFLDAIVEWRELNTAEDFISFYDEMIPLVQTLPQIVLHREKLFSALLQRVNMSARLSLEPILMLIAALSRDILEDFLPFLGRHASALLALLNDGGDRDPEILEQVFTSWSYIMMYLQKYLVKDTVQILRITAALRYFPKDYVKEFMAESVSFLLRNAPNNHLTQGLLKVLREAAKHTRIDGVVSLLWHVMKGTSTKLHSKAGQVLKFLLSKSVVSTLRDKFPDGSSTIHEVMTGLIQRLCDEVDPKELPLMYTCLFEEINCCLKDGCLEHLKCLIDFLAFALQKKQSNVFDKVKMIKFVELLVSRYVLPGSNITEASSSEVLGSILDFLLSVLDVPTISGNLSIVSPFYAPVFKLTNPSVIVFIRKLLATGPQVTQHFESQILSAMDNFIASSPEDVIFILLNFFKGSKKQIFLRGTDGNHLDSVEKTYKFFESKFSFWIELLDDTAGTGNRSSNNQVSEKEAAFAMPVQSPPCIIKWDDRVARAEEDLAHAVIVTVCGAEPLAPASEVAEVLAARLGVEVGSLVLRQASSSSYLLVLPDFGLVERLLDQCQPPLRSPAFTLLCKRWSRLAGASGRVLPCLLDIELRGIPAHVWETSTVEQFLSPVACVQQVHPNTLDLVNLTSFRCSAWCLDPAALPPTKELWVAEPPVAAVEDPPVKRFLSYPIEVRSSILLGPGAPPPPPSPAEGGGGDGSSTRRRRRHPSSPSPSTSSAGRDDDGGGARRRPVIGRVGPSSSSVDHVAASSLITRAAPTAAVLPGPVVGSQETCDVARVSPGIKLLGSAALITVTAPGNGLEGPVDGSPAAAKASSDDVAPSMDSPTLVRFEVLEDLKLPWTVGDAPGLAAHGPVDTQAPAPQVATSPVGLLEDFGLSVDGRKAEGRGDGCEVEGRGEATECLPASPRSPLCFLHDEATEMPASPPIPEAEGHGDGGEADGRGEATEHLPASPRSPLCFLCDEATDLPASPRTPPPSPPIPEFDLLVTPPLCSLAPGKPLLVYSRHRFHPSGTPTVGDATATATATAPPPASISAPATASQADNPPAVSAASSLATSMVAAEVVAAAAVPPPASTLIVPATDGGVLQTMAAGVDVLDVTPSAAEPEPDSAPLAAGVAAPTSTCAGMAVPSVTMPVADPAPLPMTREAFISNLTRHTMSLLPTPGNSIQRKKAVQPGQTPRHSRRLAGVQAEFKIDELDRRSKKKAMRTLLNIGEQEAIDQQAQNDYNMLFRELLSNAHVEALAALFNWSLPDFLDQGSDEGVFV